MPTERTLTYVFGGPVTQDYYSEEEMADALGLTVADLRSALDDDAYGPAPVPRIYCYHLHPAANGGINTGKFLFHRDAYQKNLQMHNLYLWLQQQGVWTNQAACAAWLHDKGIEGVEALGEEVAPVDLQRFVAAWEKRDYLYHERIRNYYEHLSTLRSIWEASGYLAGMRIGRGRYHEGPIFYGPDEPPQGTFIPWERLRIDPAIGFYDQEQFPRQRQKFIPTLSPDQWNPFDPQRDTLKPGDLVAGEHWVYDSYREFMGMIIVIDTEVDEIQITPNGRWLLDIDRNEIHTWHQR